MSVLPIKAPDFIKDLLVCIISTIAWANKFKNQNNMDKEQQICPNSLYISIRELVWLSIFKAQ